MAVVVESSQGEEDVEGLSMAEALGLLVMEGEAEGVRLPLEEAVGGPLETLGDLEALAHRLGRWGVGVTPPHGLAVGLSVPPPTPTVRPSGGEGVGEGVPMEAVGEALEVGVAPDAGEGEDAPEAEAVRVPPPAAASEASRGDPVGA